jgi:hypothetical protein
MATMLFLGGGTGIKLGIHLQFKCDLEQDTLGSKIKMWESAEITQRNTENHKTELSHFRPEEEMELSGTQTMGNAQRTSVNVSSSQ